MARKPDYKVGCLCKTTEYKGNIGAAWINNDKSISVVLEPFVVLDASTQLVITLFPVVPYEYNKPRTKKEEYIPQDDTTNRDSSSA